MTKLYSIGIGVGTHNRNAEWLEVFYPAPLLNPDAAITTALSDALGYSEGNTVISLDDSKLKSLADALDKQQQNAQAAAVRSLLNSSRPCVATILANDDEPASVPEAYLKLQLISHRLVRPHDINLSGIFGSLPNVAWTDRKSVV